MRENIVLYDDEGGEEQCADTQIGYQTVPSQRTKKDRRTEETSQLFATLSKKLNSSDDNFMGAPWDSRLLYKYEGSNSVLNSLSSLNSNLTDRSLDLRVSPCRLGRPGFITPPFAPGLYLDSTELSLKKSNR